METFKANGKLLIAGEYAVLDGALGLAVPCRFGQTLEVEEQEFTSNPKLYWKAFLNDNNPWFSAEFDLISLQLTESTDEKIALKLGQILMAVEKLNSGFFKTRNQSLFCLSKLEFPRNWGLGSSSTLIHLLAKFSGVDGFELNQLCFHTSGYDIACADALSPILYQLKDSEIHIKSVDFNPVFKNQLYFVHLNQKQDTQISVVESYKKLIPEKEWLDAVSEISEKMLTALSIEEFEKLMDLHEGLVSSKLGLKKVKDCYFNDYPGSVKSLGAWGGDFVMITARNNFKSYFNSRGYSTILSFDEMVLNQNRH